MNGTNFVPEEEPWQLSIDPEIKTKRETLRETLLPKGAGSALEGQTYFKDEQKENNFTRNI